MSQSVETVRAIIEGQVSGRPSGIFEVRAWLVIPEDATILETPIDQLWLKGTFSLQAGYLPFNLGALPRDKGHTFTLEAQPDPGDNPSLVQQIHPRTIITDGMGVFRRPLLASANPYQDLDTKYASRHLVNGRPFDFEANWQRVGRHTNPTS